MLVHFIHAHIRVRPHTYTSAFSHRHACTLAKVGPTTHAHTHPRMHTHACACTRANTPAHANMRTRTHATHMHAINHMQACACTTCMHAYACGICTHVPAQCSYMRTYAHARTRLYIRPHSCKHTPTYFGCALADWGHTPQQ